MISNRTGLECLINSKVHYNSMDILEINGNYGEGGGQILRSSLSLSAILQRPIHINSIRAGRKKPGLAPQHLTSVNAVAAIANAEVIGGQLGSQRLTFRPQEIRGGNYTFDVADIRPSAGALSLVFQSVALPLSFAKIPSTVALRGGTHVPSSPHCSLSTGDLHTDGSKVRV